MRRSIIYLLDIDEIKADIEMTDYSSKIKLTLVAGNRDTQEIIIHSDVRRFGLVRLFGRTIMKRD